MDAEHCGAFVRCIDILVHNVLIYDKYTYLKVLTMFAVS